MVVIRNKYFGTYHVETKSALSLEYGFPRIIFARE